MSFELHGKLRVIDVCLQARKGSKPLSRSHRLFGYKPAPRKKVPYKIWQRRSI